MAIKHGVHDTDTHYIVDPITRVAKNEGLKKVSIVRDDHNSEVCTFELPRYVEGHDMAKCNRVEVHYLNTHNLTKETSTGIYVAADFGICETDPEKVTFSWLISCAATKYPGQLAFALHFACVDDDTDEVQYWWSTALNTSISVLDSINNTTTSGEGEEEDSGLQDKTVTPTKEIQVVRPDGEHTALSKVIVAPIPDEYIVPSGSLFVDANGDYEIRDYASITVNVPPVLHTKKITANGIFTPNAGYQGFSSVTVNVPDAPATLQEKYAAPSTSDQTIEPGEGYDGLSKVTVLAMTLQDKTVNQNGEVIPDSGYDGLSHVTVNVEPKLQSKTEEITEPEDLEVVPDSGYDGLSSVKIKIAETLVGKLQEKTIKENGDHEPDEGFEGFEKVRIEVPQHVYTGVATSDGEQPVYGGMNEAIVIDGKSALIGTAAVSEGVLYTKLSFDLSSSGSTLSAVAGIEYTLNVAQSTDKWTVGFLQNGASVGAGVTYDLSQTGYRIKWAEIAPPGANTSYPYGYAKVAIQCCTVTNTGAVNAGYTLTRFIGFKSEAEYNAAMNLVYEPTTIIQINEEVIYPAEGTEA